ncbi:hypothetical protein [Streptomyces sp. NBC_01643]
MYAGYTRCTHQPCGAHLNRELTRPKRTSPTRNGTSRSAGRWPA